LAKNSGLKYRRILLKISGEAISSPADVFDLRTVDALISEILTVHALGAEIGIVIGGGNIVRGEKLAGAGFNKSRSDYMGMLATVINGMFFENAFEAKGVPAKLHSALQVPSAAEGVTVNTGMRHLEDGDIVVFAGGTGNPYFTTDTAAALRACEIGADALLKATKVDGVFDRDPAIYGDAIFYPEVSYDDILRDKLKVMDMTAVSMCRDNAIPIIIFNLHQQGNMKKIVNGESIGTIVKE
jgi:uridylate kinase